MKDEPDPELQEAFLNLLTEVVPETSGMPEFANSFASRLTEFADSWARGETNLDELEDSLSNWANESINTARKLRAAEFEMEQISRLRMFARKKMRRRLRELAAEASNSEYKAKA